MWVLLLVLSGASVLQAQSSPTLELNVVLPAVRGTIQSKDPVKKLVVDGLVAYGASEKLVVECLVVWTLTARLSPHPKPESLRGSLSAWR